MSAGHDADLTPRQASVARLVALAHSNKQIAATLGLSERRVERLLAAIVVRWRLTPSSKTAVQIAVEYCRRYGPPARGEAA